MLDLYPEIEPYESGLLDAGDGHLVYWETGGNPAGKPAVVVHGGPGSGSSAAWRRFFERGRRLRRGSEPPYTPVRAGLVALIEKNSGSRPSFSPGRRWVPSGAGSRNGSGHSTNGNSWRKSIRNPAVTSAVTISPRPWFQL